MALDELFQAMNMFKEGAQQLGVARGIQAAQDQIAQVNSNVTDEIEKRQQLENIGKNLALNMGKIGAPVSQIQSAVGAILPHPIENANAANIEGLMHPGAAGQGLLDIAKKQQTFEENPKLAQINLQGQYHLEAARQQGALAASRLEAKQSAADQKGLIDMGKQLDPTQSRAGEYGKLYNQLVQTQKLRALAANGLNMPAPQQEEFALALHRLISGGSTAHVEQVKALLPQSFVNASRRGESYVLNQPLPLNNQAWMENLMSTVNREEGVVAKNYKEIGYKRAQNFEQYRNKPETADAFARKMQTWGLDPNEMDAFIQNGGQLPDTVPQQQQQPATGGVGAGSVTRPSYKNYIQGQ